MTPPPGLTGSTLDRADRLRRDPEAFAAALADRRARLLVLDGGVPRVGDDGALSWVSVAEAAPDAELVLLGLEGGVPCFAAVAPVPAPSMRAPAMWAALAALAPGEAATLAAALGVIGWHVGHPHCARCGHPTEVFRAGWGRRCPHCRAEHFPRTDPVVIMLAEHAGRALVGRQARFPPGNYSALAGFVEPGESVEEAVRRELAEEAGVVAGEVRYLSSQPWPFGGSQLMLACLADVHDDALTIDHDELEDAMWVTRGEVRDALAGVPHARFRTPPPFAIAHTLLTAWAANDQPRARA